MTIVMMMMMMMVIMMMMVVMMIVMMTMLMLTIKSSCCVQLGTDFFHISLYTQVIVGADNEDDDINATL